MCTWVSQRPSSLFKCDGRTGVTVQDLQGSSEKGVKIPREETKQQKGLQSSQENTLPECVGNGKGEAAKVTSVRLRASMERTCIEPKLILSISPKKKDGRWRLMSGLACARLTSRQPDMAQVLCHGAWDEGCTRIS